MKTLLFILLLLGLVPFTAEACDCTFYAIKALQKVGIYLKTIPAVTVNSYYRFPGMYTPIGVGVVSVHDPANCRVLTHEFYHHYQSLHGVPLDERAERDAAIVTMFATEMRGDCK